MAGVLSLRKAKYGVIGNVLISSITVKGTDVLDWKERCHIMLAITNCHTHTSLLERIPVNTSKVANKNNYPLV